MRTKQIIAAIVVVVMGLEVSLFAQETKMKSQQTELQKSQNHQQRQGELKNRPPFPPPPPVLPGIPHLTKEQSEKIKELQLSVAQTKLPLENNLKEKEAKLRSISTVKTPDMKKIEKQIEEIGDVKVKLAKLQAAHDQEIRKVLDDEQRLIFDKRPVLHKPHHF